MATTNDPQELVMHFHLIRNLVDDNEPRVSQVALYLPSQLVKEIGSVDQPLREVLEGKAGVNGVAWLQNRQTLIGQVDFDDYTPFFDAIRAKLLGDDPTRLHVCVNWHQFRWFTRVPLQLIFDRPYDFWLPSRDETDFIVPHRGIISLDETGNILWTPLTTN